jgi:EmrB/QacA subfamily drug resistance transporter
VAPPVPSGVVPHERYEDVAIDAPGAEEVNVLPWPLLLRERLAERVEGSSKYPWLVLGTVLMGLFSVGFTITILAVSLSTIAEDVGSTKTTLTWVITGPLLAFGIVGPAFGKAGDLFGQKRMYLLGMAGSAIFAIGIALSWNAASLIAFRVLASASGAASGPASMALIYSVFPRERRVQAMGYWSMIGAGAPVLGVVAGGPIVEALSWRVIFIVQAPLTLFCMLIAALVLPETERARRVRFDVVGAVLLAFGVTSLLFALNRGPVFGWSSSVVLGAFALSPVLLSTFVWWELRNPAPLLRLDYLRRRNVAAPIATQLFTNFAYMGGFIITPFLLDEVFGYGETRIGLLSIARPLTFSIVAPLGGLVALRVGERVAGVTGALFVMLSMVLLAQLDASASDLLVVAALGLSGVGLGASSPSMAATVANAVDEDDLGIAGATQQLMTQIGVVAGIQLMQTLQVSREPVVGLVESYQSAYLLGAGVCVLGVVAAAFVRRSDPDDQRAQPAPEHAAAPAGGLDGVQ